MYKIIGGDKKEYGPVTSEQVRQWVKEGRANGQTLILAEGTTEWKPLSAFPEFADALNTPPPPPLPPWSPEACLERDYDLDLGACMSRSWEVVKANMGLLIAATFVILVVTFAAQQVVGLFTRSAMEELMRQEFSARAIGIIVLGSILVGPIQIAAYSGLYLLVLKLIRGQDGGFGDVFAGFGRPFPQLLLAGLVTAILTTLGLCLCIIPGIYLSICWIFTVPLIIDRKLNFWDAMELSRKRVHRHWLLVFCFVFISGILSAVGFCVCFVGMLVTIPMAYAFLMYAYEDIFRS